MSRGHGTVQRAILAAFAAEPDNAFLLCELCERIYPGRNRIEKKHRNAVARAAKAISSIDHMKREVLGSELVFYNPFNVMSYAMARLKSDCLGPAAAYRNNDYRPLRRRVWHGVDITSWRQYDLSYDEAHQIFREMLEPGGDHHKDVVEGGVWWQRTEICRAQARGDQETVARLQAEKDADLAAIASDIKSLHPSGT
jgi:hypothetical protein